MSDYSNVVKLRVKYDAEAVSILLMKMEECVDSMRKINLSLKESAIPKLYLVKGESHV